MTLSEIEKLLNESAAAAKAALQSAASPAELEAARVQFLGQKGFLQTAKKSVGQLKDVADKKAAGKLCNDKDKELNDVFGENLARLERAARDAELSQRLDVTLPGRKARRGHRHPLTATCDDILAVLSGLGFQPAEGPEVEHDFYNFEALNMPKDHPARDMQDTFYVQTDAAGLDKDHDRAPQGAGEDRRDRRYLLEQVYRNRAHRRLRHAGPEESTPRRRTDRHGRALAWPVGRNACQGAAAPWHDG